MRLFVKITFIVFLSIGFIVTLQSCKGRPMFPVLTTINVTVITQTSAVSGGNVTDDGGVEVTAHGVCWAATQNPTTASGKTNDGTGTGFFTSSITGLSANTKYYVRAYATNSVGTSYGNEVSFTTNPIILATLTTTTISSITSSSAISGGNITADGGGAVTARGVCWKTSTNPTTYNNKTTDASGIGSFVSNITNLLPATIYYVKAYATNSAGTTYGNEVNFKTLPVIPIVTTALITGITINSAISGGNITSDGGGAITASGVCWSTAQNPTTTDSKTTDGSGTGSFTSNITDLSANTLYYVRAYATNSAGTAYGNQRSFQTLPASGALILYPILPYGSVSYIDCNIVSLRLAASCFSGLAQVFLDPKLYFTGQAT